MMYSVSLPLRPWDGLTPPDPNLGPLRGMRIVSLMPKGL